MIELIEYQEVCGIKIPNRLMSRKEVSLILNLDQVTIWRMTKSGTFDTIKAGRSRKYTPDSVTKYLIDNVGNIMDEVMTSARKLHIATG